ncbi:MAG: SDR family NAD(P)-dependent oxidoreductase [Planctomycetota bacterium]|nr:SDR family NAD(P)-dependent oxidoreductase [Planctomycetota bacterium]
MEQGTAEGAGLRGRVALVTGAGVGIGQATAIALARAWAFVGIHWHSSEAAARETLAKVGGPERGMLLQADLTDEAQASRVVDELVARAGRLDILVNNAGALVQRSRLEDCSLELWRKTFDVNATSAFLVTRRSIPHLRATGRGAIVNILSLSTQTGGANGGGAYAAAKGALQVMTRTLARELAPEIRTNAVCPGVIETEHHAKHTSPQRMEEYRRETPLRRNGTAEEVAAAVLYLASDAAAFTNGALLDVSGGRFLR